MRNMVNIQISCDHNPWSIAVCRDDSGLKKSPCICKCWRIRMLEVDFLVKGATIGTNPEMVIPEIHPKVLRKNFLLSSSRYSIQLTSSLQTVTLQSQWLPLIYNLEYQLHSQSSTTIKWSFRTTTPLAGCIASLPLQMG